MWFLPVWVGNLFLIISLTQVLFRSGTYQSKPMLLFALTYSIMLSVSILVNSTVRFNAGFWWSGFDVEFSIASVGLLVASRTGCCSSGFAAWSSLH